MGHLTGNREAVVSSVHGLCRQLLFAGPGTANLDTCSSTAFNGMSVRVAELLRHAMRQRYAAIMRLQGTLLPVVNHCTWRRVPAYMDVVM